MSENSNEREIELHAMQQVMSTENGRAFMHRCLRNCMTFDDVYNADQTRHIHNAGLRTHGVWLASELKEATPDNYYKMLKEYDNG